MPRDMTLTPDIQQANEIVRKHYWFKALIIAAMLQADGTNYPRLAAAFPEQAAELEAYNKGSN